MYMCTRDAAGMELTIVAPSPHGGLRTAEHKASSNLNEVGIHARLATVAYDTVRLTRETGNRLLVPMLIKRIALRPNGG